MSTRPRNRIVAAGIEPWQPLPETPEEARRAVQLARARVAADVDVLGERISRTTQRVRTGKRAVQLAVRSPGRQLLSLPRPLLAVAAGLALLLLIRRRRAD